MLPTPAQMLEAERAAFSRGVTAEELMEQAGLQIADVVRQFHPQPAECHVFYGKGHNGGDVLVAARHLAMRGWSVHLESPFPNDALAPLTASRLALANSSPPIRSKPLVVLDGLLGIGATGDPRDPVAEAVRRINHLRTNHGAWVLSADIPSGLLDDRLGSPCVLADCTVAVGFAKSLLVADHATPAVGRLVIATLEELHAPEGTDPATVLSAAMLRPLVAPRPFEFHKGRAGRIGIVAGSAKYPGAARLCSAAAVKAGAGLVTLFAPPEILPALSASTIPEVIIAPLEAARDVLEAPLDAIGIGPGVGRERNALMREIIQSATAPSVVDADALNASSLSTLRSCAGDRLLTPHPGEMERLYPQNGRPRREWMAGFLKECPATLLLKGSRTIIGARGEYPVFNTTGHPGMASGGMGDVLTGVCAALIAQGKSPRDAAMTGAWACGRAAEIAIYHNAASQESLSASDVLEYLGAAFTDLRAGVF